MDRFVVSAAVEDAGFRGRCESALTHPITLASLGLLLLNDLALKSFWHGAWTTGKLSDFAWMVFAPPLLAYLLSFATRGQPRVERTAFAAAYVGLPLFYAAFNTFPALHDAVMAALLLLTGSSAGSPLDPTDSVVIPFAAATAFWVWHRPPRGVSARTGLGLLAATAAALATVATSPNPMSDTQWLVGIDETGAAVMETKAGRWYTSGDGGLTWRLEPPAVSPIIWGQQQVETPRGVYAIQGQAVMRIREGEAPVQVHLALPQTEQERWVSGFVTGPRRDEAEQYNPRYRDLPGAGPVNIVYDQATGNVIVSLGLEGALAGDEAENWRRVAVGEYVPTDYSQAGILRTLFAWRFWTAAVCVSLLFTLAAASAVRRRSEETVPGRARVWPVAARVAVVIAAVAVLLLLWLMGLVGLVVIMFIIAPFICLFSTTGKENPFRKAIAVVLATVGALAAVLNLVAGPGDSMTYLYQLLFAMAGLVATAIAVLLRIPRMKEIPVMVLAVASMTGALALLALLWASGRVNLVLGVPAGLVLLCLMAYLLYRYLNERGPGPRNPAGEEPR